MKINSITLISFLVVAIAAQLYGATPAEIEAKYKESVKKAELAKEAAVEAARQEATTAFNVLHKAAAATRNTVEQETLRTQLGNIFANKPLNLGVAATVDPAQTATDIALLAGEWTTTHSISNIRFIFDKEKVVAIDSHKNPEGLTFSRLRKCKVTTDGNVVLLEPTVLPLAPKLWYTISLPFNASNPTMGFHLGEGSSKSGSLMALTKASAATPKTVENPSSDPSALEGAWEASGITLTVAGSRATLTTYFNSTTTETEYRVKSTPEAVILENKENRKDPVRYEIAIPFNSQTPMLERVVEEDAATTSRNEILLNKK